MKWLLTEPIDSRWPKVISVNTKCSSRSYRALRYFFRHFRLGLVTTVSACLSCQDEGFEQLPDLHDPENSDLVQRAIAQSRAHTLLSEVDEVDVDCLLPLVIASEFTSVAVRALAERSFGLKFSAPELREGLKSRVRLARERTRRQDFLRESELLEVSQEVGLSFPRSKALKRILIVSMLRAPDQLVIDELLQDDRRFSFFLATSMSSKASLAKYSRRIPVMSFRQPTSPKEVCQVLHKCGEFLQARGIDMVIAVPDNYWLSRFLILAARRLSKKTVFIESLKHSRSPKYPPPASQYVVALGWESAQVFEKHFGVPSDHLAVRSASPERPPAASTNQQVAQFSNSLKVVFLNQVRGIHLGEFKIVLAELRKMAQHFGEACDFVFRHHPNETLHERSWIQNRLAGIPNLHHTFPAEQLLSTDLAGAKVAISFTSNALNAAAESGVTCVAVRSGSYLESQFDSRSRYGVRLVVKSENLFEAVVSLLEGNQVTVARQELGDPGSPRQLTHERQLRGEISTSSFLNGLLS